ncbi:hypothetical protein K710_1995 [Streptococcus iniae SF1]|nr:hypothetical protein K710_1995 [Streptococcus iniae SF1]
MPVLARVFFLFKLNFIKWCHQIMYFKMNSWFEYDI